MSRPARFLLATSSRYFGQGVQDGGTAFFYTHDQLGSVQELTDSAGAVRARYDYDPSGRRTKISGDRDADVGYTGHYEHGPSHLTLAPFRAYDANLGRWISEDPIGLWGGANLYGYAAGNPTTYVDPLGLALTSVDAAMRDAIMRGDINEIKALLEVSKNSLSQGMRQAAELAIENDSTTEGGLKSASELAKHLSDTASLEDKADAALEAFKSVRQRLKDDAEAALEKAIKAVKGHYKEIEDKWGDLCDKKNGSGSGAVGSVSELVKKSLSVDVAAAYVSTLAEAAAARSPIFRRRCLAEVDRRMKGRFRNVKGERIAAAKMFVALLPESLPVVQKWLASRRDRSHYELHFSIFCFLDDAQALPIQPSILVSLCTTVTRYLSTARAPTAMAAWMAGDLLGVHWDQPEALPALVEVALRGRYVEGRDAALDGLKRRVDRPTDRTTVLETLRRVSKQDRSGKLRRYADRILSEALRKRRARQALAGGSQRSGARRR